MSSPLPQSHCDGRVRLSLCGGARVGKSSILARFYQDEAASSGYHSNHSIQMEIVNAPGDCKADGVMIAYDITQRASFEQVQRWLEATSLSGVLVGNKADLWRERVVSVDEGSRLARSGNLAFLEVSAEDGHNIKRAFEMLRSSALASRGAADPDVEIGATCGFKLVSSGFLGAFDFVRYLAAVHIVLYHYYRKGHWPNDVSGDGLAWLWVDSGPTWVTFFFMLSGFMMTYSRYTRPKPEAVEGTLQIWAQGMLRIYPAFLLSVLMALWNNAFKLRVLWRTLPASLLLVNAWGWNYSCEKGTRWFCIEAVNVPAWYLSCLQLFYLLFRPFYFLVVRCSPSCLTLLIVGSWLYVYLWGYIYSIKPLLLPYSTGPDGWFDVPDIVHELLGIHPLSHLSKFVFGMCLARWLVDRFCAPDPHTGQKRIAQALVEPARWWASRAVLAAGAGLALLFARGAGSALRDHVPLVSMPLFALLILGLALEVDPLARLCTYPPCAWLGLVSYEVYILQESVAASLENLTNRYSPVGVLPQRCVLLLFPVVLHLLAVLARFALVGVLAAQRSAGGKESAALRGGGARYGSA